MLQSLQDQVLRAVRQWVPHTIVSRKLNQADEDTKCEYSNDFMQGTMATCTQEGSVLYKRLREDLIHGDQLMLTWIKLLASSPALSSWAKDSAKLESNVEHEATMQQRFFEAWKDHTDIVVPRVFGFNPNRHEIKMQFLPLQRLCDASPGPMRQLATESAATFFFQSIQNHQLLHGDMSSTNILICPKTGKCGVIDYGLSRVLSKQEASDLLTIRRESPTSRELLGIWFSSVNFSEDLWQQVILPAVQLGRGDTNACTDGTFVRSLIGLTRIACRMGLVWSGFRPLEKTHAFQER